MDESDTSIKLRAKQTEEIILRCVSKMYLNACGTSNGFSNLTPTTEEMWTVLLLPTFLPEIQSVFPFPLGEWSSRSTGRCLSQQLDIYQEGCLGYDCGVSAFWRLVHGLAVVYLVALMFLLFQLTFQHMLPNFNECWWDSIILGILICNWFGTHDPIL